jgi:hypothetical protein
VLNTLRYYLIGLFSVLFVLGHAMSEDVFHPAAVHNFTIESQKINEDNWLTANDYDLSDYFDITENNEKTQEEEIDSCNSGGTNHVSGCNFLDIKSPSLQGNRSLHIACTNRLFVLFHSWKFHF